jgi:nicotinamide-nucleotide amidase
MLPKTTLHRAANLLTLLRRRSWLFASAESCTGGLIAAALTHIAGSSDVVDRGFVTYSNEAKTELLGVPADLIAAHGAVSEAVARAMAEGAIAHSRANVAISVTGIAGPGGGSVEKPVGLVWFGCAVRGGKTVAVRKVFGGTRAEVRAGAVDYAFALVEKEALLF